MKLNPRYWTGKYRIGYWAYELPTALAQWLKIAALFREIWAPSGFVAEALQGAGKRGARDGASYGGPKAGRVARRCF